MELSYSDHMCHFATSLGTLPPNSIWTIVFLCLCYLDRMILDIIAQITICHTVAVGQADFGRLFNNTSNPHFHTGWESNILFYKVTLWCHIIYMSC